MRLAIITSHPIQYYAPVFKLLHAQGQIEIKVFYTLGQENSGSYDPGFGRAISWDIPLLEGYPYEWLPNTAADPGSHHYKGIVNHTLIGRIEAWQAGAVLVFGWAYESHFKAMRHFKGKIPVYFRGDSTLLDRAGQIKSIVRYIFLKWVYRYIDHAFYVGTNSKAYFKRYGLKEEQLSFAPHAVDNERFAADRQGEAVLLRKQFGIGKEEVLILFAGKLTEKKSPLFLLDTFLTLKKTCIHLLFVGNGELEAPLKLKAQMHDSVHFMDFQNQSDMPVVYQACDLFCLPSKGPGETWGLAVNEAMACGRAVLVSNKTGCAIDLALPGETGDLFNAEDQDDLSHKLARLIENKGILGTYGKNARDKIAGWSFESQVAVMTNIINHKKDER